MISAWISDARSAAAVSVVKNGLPVPAEAREAEERIYQQEAADKPENVRERIVAGKLDSWYETVVLAEQEMHNPNFEGKTVQQLRDELTATTGENIVIRRFARFAVSQ